MNSFSSSRVQTLDHDTTLVGRSSPDRQTVGSRQRSPIGTLASSSLRSTGSEARRHRSTRGSSAVQDEAQATSVERLYDHLMLEEKNFVGALDNFLELHSRQEKNKRHALFREWELDVFDKVQTQVNNAVDARSSREVSNRGAQLMQDYIDVSNTKPNGMYRDIIIPAEYDPLAAHEHTIRYDSHLRHDPCKLELRKQADSGKGKELRPSEYHRGAQPRGGAATRMSVALWDKLEATPYGRLGKVVPRADSEPWSLHNRVTYNEYNVAQGREVLSREFPRGKKCWTQPTASLPL